VKDLVMAMVLEAPTFIDNLGYIPKRSLDTRFEQLVSGIDRARKNLGEERYARLQDLAARAKALFVADQEDTNGKTDEGRELLFQMEDILAAVRRRRVVSNLPDPNGEVTGD
jgi:hypothetical protein